MSDSHLLQIHKVLWHVQHHTNTRLQPLGGSAVVKSRQQHPLSLLTPIGESNSCKPLHSILALPQLISKKKKVSPEAASPLFCKDGLSHLPASLLQIQKKKKTHRKANYLLCSHEIKCSTALQRASSPSPAKYWSISLHWGDCLKILRKIALTFLCNLLLHEKSMDLVLNILIKSW